MFTSGTVDYLTITAKPRTIESNACEAVFQSLLHDEATQGMDVKPARALGYVGEKCGTMFLGSHANGHMFRASGELAELSAKMFAWIGGNHHVTRIDFQLTWGWQTDIPERATLIAGDVRQAQAKSPPKVPPAVRLISSFGKGDTVTVGARASEVFIRVYDKTREMKADGPPWLWRYEVELKGTRALQAMRLYSVGNADNEVVHQVVDYWCRDRMIPVPWSAETPLDWPEVGRPVSDDEKSLRWLETHVKRTVDRLVMHGHRQLVLECLGLDQDT